MTQKEKFVDAIFSAFNAVVQLITTVIITQKHESIDSKEFNDSIDALCDIMSDIKMVMDESKFKDQHLYRHVQCLNRLIEAIK